MKKALTHKQRRILDYIEDTIRTTGYPPTIRQIGDEFGIRSTNGVRRHLIALEKKGYIRRRSRISRGIEILGRSPILSPNSNIVEIPIIGRVAAGSPILAEENIEGNITVDKGLVKSDEAFALRVKGDSMADAGIYDGDFVIVRPQMTAENGDIVVALVDDEEVTVKRFYKEKDKIRLQPANSHMQPILTDEVRILGKITGLMRLKI